MPKEIKYGYLRGPVVMTDEWPIAASVVFSNRGGKFVVVDANNRIDRAGASDTAIIGWLNIGTGTGTTFTSSSTAGQDKGQVNISHLSVYRMPTDSDPANTRGETADLIVTSNIQYVNPDASAVDIVQILALDTTDDTVDVRLWTANVTSRAVA